MAARAVCRDRASEFGMSCPNVTFVLPGKPDECPQGEYVPRGAAQRGFRECTRAARWGRHLSHPRQ